MGVRDDFVISDIKLDGFQIVSGQYFLNFAQPNMSVWPGYVVFNISAYDALSACETVQLWVSAKDRKIIVEPVNSRDPNAVNWLKGYKAKRPSRVYCSMFAMRLYEEWDWDLKCHYRANGRLVKSDKKLMLLFDFTEPETFLGQKVVPNGNS